MTMPASGGEPGAARSPRWLKTALIASLAVNLLVLGTIGGSLWAFRHGPWSRGGPNAHLLGFTHTLSEDRRSAIWQATREERQALRPLRKEVGKARAEVRALLTAQPFDQQKFAEAQARVLAAEIAARSEANKLFIAVAGLLTPEERVAFANWKPAQRAMRMRLLSRDRSGGDSQPSPSSIPASTIQPR
jgi:uncharacterized membrane protein